MNPSDQPDDPGLAPTGNTNSRGPYVGTPGQRPVRRFSKDAGLNRVFRDLQGGFGAQEWWPAETPFEVIAGAILTQNTSWRNVELALAGLRERKALTPAKLLALEHDELSVIIRPSGFHRSKAKKLHAISRHYLEAGGLRGLREGALESVRRELLAVHGVGPETADSILCYAAGRRTVVVDTYTRRVLVRHGLLEEDLPYEEVRGWLTDRLVRSQVVYEEFHALCVRAGYEHCKPKARCATCPAATPPALAS